MNLSRQLEGTRSAANIQKMVDFVGNDATKFSDLMQFVDNSESRKSGLASWVMSYCVEENPGLLLPYFSKILALLESSKSTELKRNLVRALQFEEIPEEFMAQTFDVCLNFLKNETESIAVKAFSMTVLLNICRKEPDLADEVIWAIQPILVEGSAGERNRANKVVKELEKMKGK